MPTTEPFFPYYAVARLTDSGELEPFADTYLRHPYALRWRGQADALFNAWNAADPGRWAIIGYGRDWEATRLAPPVPA